MTPRSVHATISVTSLDSAPNRKKKKAQKGTKGEKRYRGTGGKSTVGAYLKTSSLSTEPFSHLHADSDNYTARFINKLNARSSFITGNPTQRLTSI